MFLEFADASEESVTKEIPEQYKVENRVDYTQKLPCADDIMNEYMKLEQSKVEKERERFSSYRICGKPALTWGWFMEALQKGKEDDTEEINRE